MGCPAGLGRHCFGERPSRKVAGLVFIAKDPAVKLRSKQPAFFGSSRRSVKEPGFEKVLALNTKRLAADWQAAFEHPVLLAETFVDHSRFAGTCYTVQPGGFPWEKPAVSAVREVSITIMEERKLFL